jgi:5-formyltetrahydrofolate cyclo-ligase
MVKLQSYQDYLSLPLNSWGIPEPRIEDGRVDCFANGGLDFIVMPGLAFDSHLNRIGYGKG